MTMVTNGRASDLVDRSMHGIMIKLVAADGNSWWMSR